MYPRLDSYLQVGHNFTRIFVVKMTILLRVMCAVTVFTLTQAVVVPILHFSIANPQTSNYGIVNVVRGHAMSVSFTFTCRIQGVSVSWCCEDMVILLTV